MQNKKAALELSINAIVVLILAITILGLGIGFIRGQFGGLSEQFTQVRSEIKDQLLEKIQESGELLVFNRAELQASIGKTEVFYIGIKNNQPNADGEGSVCYRSSVRCIKPLRAGNFCSATAQANNVIVGGYNDGTVTQGDEWFRMFDEIDINDNDVGVFPITVQIARGSPDTYAMEMVITKDSANKDCDSTSGIFEEYQSKQFFVVLN